MKVEVTDQGRMSREEWDSFVARAVNGTLFHRLAFLSYHPPSRFRFHHLLFRQEGRPVALLPSALREEENGTALCSPAGASFGGPVLAEGLDPRTVKSVMESLVEHARGAACRRLRLTPPPPIYWQSGTVPARESLRRALQELGFRTSGQELSQEVPLEGTEENLWENLDRQARKAVNKAAREGIQVSISRRWGTFFPLLEKNRRRHGAAPTHTLEDLRRLDELVGESLVLFLAQAGETVVGGTLIFRCRREVALNFYLCHDEDWQNQRPSDLLVWESMRWARREGCRHYDFGTSSLAGVLNQGLWRFKKKFGARDSFRETYTLELDMGES